MTTAEKNLWKWLKGAEENVEDRAKLHWERIENVAGNGTPDVEGCYGGACFVIELKSVARGKRTKLIRTKLTTTQAMFLRSRFKAGGLSWILVEVGGDRRYLIPGNFADQIVKPVPETLLKKIAVQLIDETPIDVLTAVVGK